MDQIRDSKTFRRRQVCRLCGFYDFHDKDILENTPNAENYDSDPNELSEKIFRCVGVRVEESDQMTTKICHYCFGKIDEFDQFRELCAFTDMDLRIQLALSIDDDELCASDIVNEPDAEPKFDDETRCTSIGDSLSLNVIGNKAHMFSNDKQTDFFAATSSLKSSPSTSWYESRTTNTHDGYAMTESFVVHHEERPNLTPISFEENLEKFFNITGPLSANTTEDASDLHQSRTSGNTPVLCVSLIEDESYSDLEIFESSTDDVTWYRNTNEKSKKKMKRKAVKNVAQFLVNCQSNVMCKDLFESWDSMEYHVTTYHAEGIKRKFSCYLCKRSLGTRHTLQQHINTVHIGLRPFQCPFLKCSQTFAQKVNLQYHTNITHAKKDVHKCKKCPMIFYRKWLLRCHLVNEHGIGSIHRCHMCNKSLANRNSLQLHMDSIHRGLGRFKCPIAACSEVFAEKKNLQIHTNAKHTKNIEVKCTNHIIV